MNKILIAAAITIALTACTPEPGPLPVDAEALVRESGSVEAQRERDATAEKMRKANYLDLKPIGSPAGQADTDQADAETASTESTR